MSELSLLKKELFGDATTAISDIKFYPGENSQASIEEIAGYTRAALADIRSGTARDIDLSF
ncbi:hypothetical protein [Polymorphobacter megasporae]|uniref:hypothetical protein n=1 Tax=Glacieibacterium megasporae TaxID=2835787 RepID=UPI001C1E10E5|nr:hypothetical protein [Polymorphobacter megasporae]UAJ11226.1 hypothetical protein KTC28_05835 [Polymorphobacter megasporae]